MEAEANGSGWKLEVVRGRKPGQVFALAGREMILGNSPTPPAVGIDLAGQEGPTARRMEAHHAALAWPEEAPSIRDLDSSCGTFVNRRRVLPGQALALRAGDEIQLGSVVLRLTRGDVASTNGTTASANAAFAYAIEGGPTCRSWDDFLVASAQKWEELGCELASGRIDAFLVKMGREDLLPRSAIGSGADDRLDAWLASLPTTRPSRPELDVHPKRIVVRATAGGGTVRKTARISNVGYRLLRCSAHVEPPDITWLRLAPEFDDVSFSAVEETDLAFEVVVPEVLPGSLPGEIVVEGNGGTKRISVILEPRRASDDLDGPSAPVAGPSPLAAWLAGTSLRATVAASALGLLAARLVVAIAGGPGLGRVASAFGAAGLLIGGVLAARRGGLREAFPGGFAGACVGALVAAVVVAACRAVEPAVLGGWSASTVAVCVLWAAIGAGLAVLAKYSGRVLL